MTFDPKAEAEKIWRSACPFYLQYPTIDREDEGKMVACDWKVIRDDIVNALERAMQAGRESCSCRNQKEAIREKANES